MEQSFIMMAPGAQEVVNSYGTIGEILFDGSAGALVELLAVPVLPKHSTLDDAESDKPQRCGDDGLSVGSPSAKRKREDLQEQPTGDCKRPRVQRDSELELSRTAHKRTGIHDLPVELHDLIFDHLDINDVFVLCISNRYFWNVGLRRIRAHLMSNLARWANRIIVCVGEDIHHGDYPPAMFTKAGRAELWPQLYKMKLWDFYDFSFEVAPVSIPTTFLHQLMQPTDDYLLQLGSCGPLVLAEAFPDINSFYPKDQSWILRNLTTKEYVRSEAIALEPEHIHGPHIDYIGFGEVVLSRICWTADGTSTSMKYDGNIQRGVWAAHRFDITTLERHNEQTKSNNWHDVSKAVAEEIATIWEGEYGRNWRQKITRGEWADLRRGRSW